MRSNPHYKVKLEDIFDDACAERIAKDALSSELKKHGRRHPCIDKINYRGMDGLTPLYWPIRNGNIEAVRTMLSLGADPNIELWGEFEPHSYVSNAVFSGDNELLSLLLEAGANPSRHKDSGRWSVWSAVLSRNYEALRMIIDSGVNPNVSDTFANTILSDTIAGRDFHAAYILLESGADPRMPSVSGVTPIRFMNDYGCVTSDDQKEWCYKFFERVAQEHGISIDPTPRWPKR